MAEPSKYVWDQDRDLTEEEEARLEERRKKSGASQALGAAMVAVGEIIDPSKTHVVAVAEAEDDLDDDDLQVDLDFGELPPL